MKREMVGFPKRPAIPWATEERCMTLEAGFVQQLLGLCGVLQLYRMWDGTDEEIAIVQAQVEKGIAALMGCGCADGVATIRTSKAGYLESVDQDGNVTILGDTFNQDSVERFPDEQPVDLPGDNICAGSRQLVERILGDVLFSLDQAQFAVDGFKTVGEGLSLLLNTIPLTTVTMGAAYDAWEEWVIAAASLTISTLKIAFSDPAVKDKMTENIYCAVMDSPSHLLTEEIYFDALQDLPLLEAQSTILARFMAGFEIPASGDVFATAERWYLLGALNEDNTCSAQYDCDPEWCLMLDLTASNGGFAVGTGLSGGVWVSGQGWKPTTQIDGGGYHRNIAIGNILSGAVNIHRIESFMTYTAGEISDGTFAWNTQVNEAPRCTSPATLPPTLPWECSFAEDEAESLVFWIPVGVTSGHDPGGDATFYQIKIYGTGSIPTLTGWTECEE